jgi:hypothetical protein
MSRNVYFVHDGQEFDFDIPDYCSTHPLPSEAVTAALDTLTVAVLGLVGVFNADDDEDGWRRLELVAATVVGMREKLGFGGQWRDEPATEE